MTENAVKRLGLILAIQSQYEAMKLENERWRLSGMVPKWNEKELLKYTDLLAEATQIDNHGVEKMSFEIKEILHNLNNN
jgi:hypothetical protein